MKDTVILHIRAHYLSGIHSGIPRCCVIAFCRDQLAHRTELRNYPFAIYRPCRSCYAKLILGKIKPAILNVCTPDSLALQTSPFVRFDNCGIPNKAFFNYWYALALDERISLLKRKLHEIS